MTSNNEDYKKFAVKIIDCDIPPIKYIFQVVNTKQYLKDHKFITPTGAQFIPHLIEVNDVDTARKMCRALTIKTRKVIKKIFEFRNFPLRHEFAFNYRVRIGDDKCNKFIVDKLEVDNGHDNFIVNDEDILWGLKLPGSPILLDETHFTSIMMDNEENANILANSLNKILKNYK